ncbi:MAG TPA: protein kinase [Gemmatimonadales bacterium]|nr:protein kinase [Gemmatimonadales bacterium]
MTNGVLECFRCHTPIPENSRFCSACGADVSGGGTAPSTSNVDVVRERLQRVIEGKYRIERLLGKGGMGTVFLAHDLTLEREVAIKVLPPDVAQDEQVVRRFQQEAKTAAKLDHPNIIPIYRVESEGGLNYFVMKYISGTSLEDLLEKKEPLAVPEIQRILWEAACALGHAHQRGVVHRDVKPANIMFDHDGRVMLTDFGISKALQAATGFTATGMIIGTPHYMAPEQGKGTPVDGRADQYSLGVVGYRMITAELPFNGDSVHTIIYKHIYEEPPLASIKRPGIPGTLTVAISRALSKEPDQRFQTMEEFATAVWPEQPVAAPAKGRGAARPRPKAAADAPTEITGAPTTPLPSAKERKPAPPPRPRRRSRAPVIIGVVVVAAGLGGYLLLGRSGSGDHGPVGSGGEPAPRSQVPPIVDTVRIEDTVRVPTQGRPRTTRSTGRVKPRDGGGAGGAAAEAASQGLLTIAADPFGEVYVDGVDAGQTPLVEYALKPGRHTIRIEHPGFKTVTETVQVDANNTVRKRYTLLPE